MTDRVELLGIYLHLARASELRRRPLVRDRLLILGSAVAASEGLVRVAAYCRHRVLEHNPRHLLQRWPTVGEAMLDSDFACLLGQLQRRYPPEKAEHMLDNLGIDTARERESYFSDEEYAAAILGTSTETLNRMFGRVDRP